VELADCIKILDRYFEQQFGKGSNFYKQAWLPVKRASKPVELSTTAPNTTKVAICPVRAVDCEFIEPVFNCKWDGPCQHRPGKQQAGR